jgi:hypothetical protein
MPTKDTKGTKADWIVRMLSCRSSMAPMRLAIIGALLLTAISAAGQAKIAGEDPLDRFGNIGRNFMFARLDNLINSLRQNDSYTGIIELSFRPKQSKRSKSRRLDAILSHVQREKFPLSRINLYLQKENTREETILWVRPAGAPPPRYMSPKKLLSADHLPKPLIRLFA